MSNSDLIAFAGLFITIGTIIFMVGKNAQRLQVAENDLNNLGRDIRKTLADHDNRLDRQATFVTRLDQKVLYLEERVFGNDTAARIRGE